MKYDPLSIIGLALISVIVLSVALPVTASASTIRVPVLDQQSDTSNNTSTMFGVEALIAVLEFNVKRVSALFDKWNITDNETWGKLREINESIAKAKTLLDEGNITGARALAIELLRDLVKLVRNVALIHAHAAKNMSKEQLKLIIRIRVLNKTIDVLLNASNKLEAVNKTLAVEYNETLMEARKLLDEALKLVYANNTSGVEELLEKAKELIEKARGMLKETAMVRVKEHIKQNIDKIAEKLNETIRRLEGLAKKLEEEGLTQAAQAIENVTMRLKKILEELLNNTESLFNETVPPRILVRIYENMMHDIKELKHHIDVTEKYSEKVRELHGGFKHIEREKANLSMIFNSMKNMAQILPGKAREKLNAIASGMESLDKAMIELRKALETCNKTLVEQAKDEVLARIDEMKQQLDDMKNALKGIGGKIGQGMGPFMKMLDKMEHALDEMKDRVEEMINQSLKQVEECEYLVVNVSQTSLKDIEKKINNTIAMIKECKHCPMQQASDVKVRLEEALKLIVKAGIQLRANNTSGVLKLLVQAKHVIENSVEEKHIPGYIKSEIKRTEEMIEAVIEQLKD